MDSKNTAERLRKTIEAEQKALDIAGERLKTAGSPEAKKYYKEQTEFYGNNVELLKKQLAVAEELEKKNKLDDADEPPMPLAPGGADKSDKKLKDDLARIEKAAALKRIAAMQNYSAEKIDKEAFEKELLKIERETIEAKKALYGEGSDEYVKYLLELNKFDLKNTEDREKAEKDRREKIRALIEKYGKEAAVTDEQKKQRELEYLDSLYKEELRKTEEYLYYTRL